MSEQQQNKDTYINRELNQLGEIMAANTEYLKSSQVVFADKIKKELGNEIKKDLEEQAKPKKVNKVREFFNKLFSIYG